MRTLLNRLFIIKKENLVKLFLCIKKYAPEFENANLEKEKVWKALFPGTEYNYGIMKNLIFELNKLLEQYIVVTKLGKDKLLESRYLLTYLNEKNLPKLFFNKFDSIERTYDRDYFNSLNLQAEDFYGFWFEMLSLKAQVEHYALAGRSKDIDNFCLNCVVIFLINSFKLYQNLEVHNSGWNKNFEKNPVAHFLNQITRKSFDEILENVKRISETDYICLKIYYNMYCMFIENKGERYLDFKKILFDNTKIFSKKDLRDLYFCLFTGNGFVKNNDVNTPSEKLSIFDNMINLNILTEPNGVMAEHIFINYINYCNDNGDIIKMNQFSEMHIDKLKKDIRPNLSKYLNSLILYLEGKYEDSLNLISQIDPDYFMIKIYVKHHKGKCLYKIQDYELFLNEYDSVKHFVRNSARLNVKHKFSTEKFYYFIDLLFKLRENYNEYELSRLKKEALNSYKNEKNWILNEISKLESEKG